VRAAANCDPCRVALSGCERIKRAEQQLDVRKTAGAICVGHEESSPAGVQHAVAYGTSLATIALELHDTDVRFGVVFGRELERSGGSAVGGTVVYDEDLEGAFCKRCKVVEGG
jgi:hypothetical protein